MADRIFADLARSIKGLKELRDEYMILFHQHPAPWSNIVKVSFRAQQQLLQENLNYWDECISKLENKASRYLDLDAPALKTAADIPTPTPTLSTPNVNIQKFDGDFLKWKSFKQRFDHSIHLKNYPNVEKMIALLGLLEGDALAEVQGFEVSSENYLSVYETLEERFGNDQILISQLQTKLRSIPPAKQEARSIRDTVNAVTNMVRQLQNLNVDTNNIATILDVIEKMPQESRIKLRIFSMSSRNVTIDQILQKMKDTAFEVEVVAADEKEHSARKINEQTSKVPFKPTSPNERQFQNWNSQEDTLILELKNDVQDKRWTKRKVLKFIASTFDPLGMLSPVSIKGKIFMQNLFQKLLSWDTPLSDELQKEWQEIVRNWKGNVTIPRKLVHGTMPEKDSIEIHAFADASKIAYCACVYLRMKTSKGHESVLVFAKTRLHPLSKTLTIPKMEVMGIWLASKIASFVQKEMKLETSRKFIWTDSQISFYWFQKLPKDVFVCNRLKDVLASNVELLFVPGTLNPADLGTRGVSIEELNEAKCWWHGPQFLQETQDKWPKTKDVTQTINALISISSNQDDTIVLQNVEMIRKYEIEKDLRRCSCRKPQGGGNNYS
uniref:Uncharacterized protein n=1 Tax=Panagrolaimus superbus TaxID=310955 RepID=A0A914YUF9_9BILA